ncbi:hypothetical protein [Shewanella marina]|uniref:hypothetical protein n=1 Tax=Shewanella marina TaxID=487319 RepID=UPI00046F75F1|nr:hypothetical protein [Shewanella marina]
MCDSGLDNIVAATVFDELATVDDCRVSFIEYYQSPRVLNAQNQGLTQPRLVFTSAAGTCLNIWPAGGQLFNLHIGFEHPDFDDGRFQNLFEALSVDNILLLLADDWTDSELLMRWQPV